MRTFGPGTYDATLHLERVIAAVGVGHLMNDDYFRLEVPDSGASVLRRAAVSVHQANRPVDVTLYDAAQEIIRAWTAIRNVTIYPPSNSRCYLTVAGSVADALPNLDEDEGGPCDSAGPAAGGTRNPAEMVGRSVAVVPHRRDRRTTCSR